MCICTHIHKIKVLDGANKYKCCNCGVKTRATKRFSLHRLPYVLQLHLKRFETQWGGHSAKVLYVYIHTHTRTCMYTHTHTKVLYVHTHTFSLPH